ncbi:MAG: hypothetical protein OXD32_06200 [Endozoicomonadaceae bacterium]|nr:hypothetical protein [Endozoicomonadaceae bacterium]
MNHAVSIGFDGTKWLACNHNTQMYTNNLSSAVEIIFDDRYVINSHACACLEILENKGDNLVVNRHEQNKKS